MTFLILLPFGAFAAGTMLMTASGLMFNNSPDPQSYNMMKVYPEEITSEVQAALRTEQLLKPLTDFFGKDPFLSESYQSCGSIFYDTLCDMDTKFYSYLSQWMQSTPREVAFALGLPESSIRGAYDPLNSAHKADRPDTWNISSWENLKLQILDGDDLPVTIFSNNKEILSMASVYTYAGPWSDTALFEKYITDLWNSSHRFHIDISPVYYCKGCKTEDESSDNTGIKKYYCPGHIDLTVTVKIYSLEGKTNLYTIDSYGSEVTEDWNGWTEDKMRTVNLLSAEDWTQMYGLSPYEPGIGVPLGRESVVKYQDYLSDTVSDIRKTLIETALNSVGKIPYYYGGKTSRPGFEQNQFGTFVSPDYKGRRLSGLDCSGWVSWVYTTATGIPLAENSTSTLAQGGRAISADELQPGDVVVRIGSAGSQENDGTNSHAAIFLSWNSDGTMNIIHETGFPVNNVTVATVNNNWMYYRSYLD